MKALFICLVLLFSVSASAQVVNVYPQIFNMGNSIQVQIFNNTEDNINCSGQIYMNTQSGHMESTYYWDIIRKGGYSMRPFYLINFNDRVLFSSHSIMCLKAP